MLWIINDANAILFTNQKNLFMYQTNKKEANFTFMWLLFGRISKIISSTASSVNLVYTALLTLFTIIFCVEATNLPVCLYSLKAARGNTSNKRQPRSARARRSRCRRFVTSGGKTRTSTASWPMRKATRPVVGCNSKTSYPVWCRGNHCHKYHFHISVTSVLAGISARSRVCSVD